MPRSYYQTRLEEAARWFLQHERKFTIKYTVDRFGIDGDSALRDMLDKLAEPQAKQEAIAPVQEQVIAWFSNPDHLGKIDHQIRMLSFPDPVAWVWKQWDGVILPDGTHFSLCTTVYVTENSRTCYASCAVFSHLQWNEVCRTEYSHLLSPQVLEEVCRIDHVRPQARRYITSLSEEDIQTTPFLEAFVHDVQITRNTTLQVLYGPFFRCAEGE